MIELAHLLHSLTFESFEIFIGINFTKIGIDKMNGSQIEIIGKGKEVISGISLFRWKV